MRQSKIITTRIIKYSFQNFDLLYHVFFEDVKKSFKAVVVCGVNFTERCFEFINKSKTLKLESKCIEIFVPLPLSLTCNLTLIPFQ